MSDGPKNGTVYQSAVSGAVAGFVSRLASAPFDVLKIRFQLQDHRKPKYHSIRHAVKDIIKGEGVQAFWKGSIPAIYLWVSFSGVQFSCYGWMKQLGEKFLNLNHSDVNTQKSTVVNFASGAGSGIVATVVTYPFDIMRTQFAIQGKSSVHRSMIDFVRNTFIQRKIPGFFHGLMPALGGVIPFMGLNFAIYEHMKNILSSMANQHFESIGDDSKHYISSTLVNGVAGGIAGGLSKLCVYPFDTMKKRMQAYFLTNTFQDVGKNETKATQKKGISLRECFVLLIRNEGVSSLFKGMYPTLMKSVVSTGVTFAVFDACFEALRCIDGN